MDEASSSSNTFNMGCAIITGVGASDELNKVIDWFEEGIKNFGGRFN
ncbi:MAG: hypothetical protein ABF289_01685 [Clostridiales bacterium]